MPRSFDLRIGSYKNDDPKGFQDFVADVVRKNPRIQDVHWGDDGSVLARVILTKQQYREFIGDEKFLASKAWDLFPDEVLTPEESALREQEVY